MWLPSTDAKAPDTMKLMREGAAQTLIANAWWKSSCEFQDSYRHNLRTKPLGEGSIKFRRLCRALAANQRVLRRRFRRIASLPHFFCEVCTELLGFQIELADIFVLYCQLTKRVLLTPEASGTQMVSRGMSPPTCWASSTRFLFPNSDPKIGKRCSDLVKFEIHPMQVL